MSAVQPLYGKLSDIYGRKPVLLVAYAMFAIGNLGAGLGGAGMGSLVAIIIVDIVPMHDVASIRSYVNIMQTSGRTCGGVIGGWLTQTLGWRW
jgi:MFS family permease